MKASVEKQIALGFGASVAGLLLFFLFSCWITENSLTAQAWVTHTYKVIATLEQGRANLTDAETAQRAFLLTGDEKFAQDSERAQSQVNAWLATVRGLTTDNPQEQKWLDELQPLIARRLTLLNNRIQSRREQGLSAAAAGVGTREGADLAQQISQYISKMQAAEDQLLGTRQRTERGDARMAEVLVAGAGILACALGLISFLMVRRDLRLRKNAEEMLRQNEERIRLMIENISDYAIILLDPKGNILSWNGAAQHIKGYTETEILGRHFSKLYPEEAVRSGFCDEELKIAAEQGRCENESWHVRKDGSRFWANVVITAIRARDGKLRGFVNVTRDLTEHKRLTALVEHERHLMNQLMDSATEDIYFKDKESRFLRINRYHAGRFGLNDPAQAVGKSDADFFSREHAEQARQDEEEVMRTGRPITREEMETWLDGHVTWALTVKLPLRDPTGEIIGTFGLSRDISQRKAGEEEIKKLNESLRRHSLQLEMANKELEAFSYSVSHDLRAPLRHIDGFVKLLEKNAAGLDERSRRYLAIITDSAQRMGALIDDLLIFSRMGRAELRQTRVESDSLVHEILDSLQPETEGRNIQWKIAPLPQIRADPAMLRQVWANLIANAIKYSRPRDPATIEIGCNEQNGDWVFYVHDNGVGFDMKYAHKLFGVFQRLHRAEEFEGTGIGLANVQRIVLRHGGRVWAEGKLNDGATFFFALPKDAH